MTACAATGRAHTCAARCGAGLRRRFLPAALLLALAARPRRCGLLAAGPRRPGPGAAARGPAGARALPRSAVEEMARAVEGYAEGKRERERQLQRSARVWRREGKDWEAPPDLANGEPIVKNLRHGNNILTLEASEFPPYRDVRPEHVGRAMDHASHSSGMDLVAVLDNFGVVNRDTKDWVEPYFLLDRLEMMQDKIERAYRAATFLKDYVDNSPKMVRAWKHAVRVRNECLRRLRRNHALMPHFKRFAQWSQDEAERRAGAAHMILFELDGVNLDEWGWARNNADEFVQAMSCRQNFMDIALEWEDLVRIETDKRAFLVRDVNDIAGLPQFLREDMSNAAVHRGYPASTPETGPWLVMHVPAMVEPILRHATQRKFRDFVYSTHARIGYTGGTGDGDTTEMLDKLLGERLKYANLLGFPTYADLAFTLKMGTKQQVYAFLGRLRRESLPVARRQLAELQQFATSQGAGHQLEHFDLEYWRERLLESRLGLSEGYLRDFFQLPTVLDGLFGLLRRLFGVRFVREEAPAESKWDPHVIFYRLVDEDSGVVMSSLFIDPYSRRWRKKPGFAVEPVQHRSTITPLADNFTEAGARKAAVTIVCDFLPPRQEGDVALLTHRDVAKLFHTMGGALRTLLTNTTTGLMADDTYLELDAQSMPAHFLERWAFDKTTLRSMSSHVETGDSLPEPAIDAIVSSRSFHRTISMLRRVFQAQVDLDLHAQYDPNGEMTTQDVAKLIEAEFSVIPPRTRDHELNSWPLHAERGCGLYSDLWSEALAADAFAVFEESGLENAEAVGGLGRRFRGCILAPAAGRSPAGGLQEFLGRPLSLATFLRAHGVAPGRAGASGEGPAAGFDDYEDIYEDDADFVELEAYDEPEEDGDSAEREDDVEADVPDATG